MGKEYVVYMPTILFLHLFVKGLTDIYIYIILIIKHSVGVSRCLLLFLCTIDEQGENPWLSNSFSKYTTHINTYHVLLLLLIVPMQVNYSLFHILGTPPYKKLQPSLDLVVISKEQEVHKPNRGTEHALIQIRIINLIDTLVRVGLV